MACVNVRLACVVALFWGRVSVLLILEGLERNAKKITRKNKKGEISPFLTLGFNSISGSPPTYMIKLCDWPS